MKTYFDILRESADTSRIPDRITATEVIGDMECRITLEKDSHGCYREIDLTPIGPSPEREAARQVALV